MLNEQKLKEMAERDYASRHLDRNAQQGQCELACEMAQLGNILQTTRPLLTKRIRTRLDSANNEAVRASQLAELNLLLETNPVITRILELIEQVGL